MIELIAWTDRTWAFGCPLGVFPALLERLRGTPVRAAELLAGVPDEISGSRTGAAWSAKEHVGHLSDLNELDEQRLDDFAARADVLTAADMTNRRTETAGHNTVPVETIIARLREGRLRLVERLERLSEGEVDAACLHPRLRQRLRVVDWVFFVAEHDDHHLARARRALRGGRNRG